MSRAIRFNPRTGSATFDLVAIARKLEKGTLTAAERRIYKRVFGMEPEELRRKPSVGDKNGSGENV
jgi:hypothetical protein